MSFFNTTFSSVSLNVRGLRDSIKRKATFLFLKNEKAHCYLIQETHSNDTDEKIWSNQWGEKIYFSHGTNRSAGVAILLHNFPGKVISTKKDSSGHWIICIFETNKQFLILGNLYGYNNLNQNKQLITELTSILTELSQTYINSKIILGGDYNMVMDEWLDRQPSKFQNHQINCTLSQFCNDFNLNDIWRIKNPDKQIFTWFKPDGTIKSRLDFWLVSEFTPVQDINCSITAAPLTDHCMVKLIVSPINGGRRNKGYWKFNSNLLKNEHYCHDVIRIIEDISKDTALQSYSEKWEFLKYKIRQISISHGKTINRANKQKEIDIMQEIHNTCNKNSLSEQEKQKLIILHSSLDNIYINKAKGAYIRSRAKWIEEGERSSAYFCRLEKRRQERNTIKTLIIDGEECNDPARISKEIFQFYSQLYSSSYSQSDADKFFESIAEQIPRVDECFRKICDAEIRMEEVEKALKCLSLDKSPGSDGLTTNFYRHFWINLKDLFFNLLKEILTTLILPNTMKQGVITLIPKPGKDQKVIDNLRPITLLNNDYKMLTHIFSNRLKTGITDIISETQSGFIKGRSIHNNIRLIFDLIDYKDLINDKGFILFLDFFKAFDMLEHEFMFKTLKMLGFGNYFINFVKLIYTDTNSTVILPQGTSPRFSVNRGIKQGCPISPLLFIAAAEMLSILVKKSDFDKLAILGKQLTISQLADDTAIFMKNSDQLPKILDSVNFFSKASGLRLNLNKCELLPIFDCNLSAIHNIPVKTTVKYLGIHITNDIDQLSKLNTWNCVEKSKTHLNSWSQRDISIIGRTFLTKMECISRFIYPAYSLSIPKDAIRAINQTIFNFIWKGKTHYIKKGTMVKEYEEGGVKAIDFDCINGTIKINWLRHFLKQPEQFWFHIPNEIFTKLGGIKFLLLCDYDLNKLPIKISSFHQQTLLYWRLIYKHNFSPHMTPLWNCRYVLHKNKSIFLQSWFDRGIWSVMHLLDCSGKILAFENFSTKYNITDKRLYNQMVKAIPQAVLSMASDLLKNKIKPSLPSLMLNGYRLNDFKLTNFVLRNILNKEIFPNPSSRNSILNFFSKKDTQILRSKFYKFPIAPKIKENHFKILNRIYPSAEFLSKRFGFENNNCSFCNEHTETTDHLFWECMYSEAFWDDLHHWLSKYVPVPAFECENILYGFVINNFLLDMLVNVVVILGKFFIHKCRFLKCKPVFYVFHKEMSLFFSSLKHMKKRTAVKLLNMIEDIKLMDNP